MAEPEITDNAAAKAAWRERAKAARAAAVRPGAGAALVPHVLALARDCGARTASGYWPIGDEIDVRPALAALVAAGVVVALPVIVGRAQPLAFRAWRGDAPLVARAWGIREPGPDAAAVRPDLLLVPLLAFDACGYRLGYGGGYYDRTLARLRGDGGGPAFACGVAYAAQRVDKLPRDPYDMALDAVLTEQGPVALGGTADAEGTG
ncbi:MAG: 5-formyltetrahydrofolate cyclo-ligase [Alphaproteobacteria bacterium]